MMTIMISGCYKTKNLRYRYFNKERALQQTCHCKYTIVTDELIISQCSSYAVVLIVACSSSPCMAAIYVMAAPGIVSVQPASGEDGYGNVQLIVL